MDDDDCSGLAGDVCMTWVCNDGTFDGPVGFCVEVPELEGTPCDDGLFCTLGDTCDGTGVCEGNIPNDCGLTPSSICETVVCDESAASCSFVAVNEGEVCDSSDLCAPGVCVAGSCDPSPVDCSNLDGQCVTGECDPATGACHEVPVVAGTPCSLSGLAECEVAACDGQGACLPEAAPDGTLCDDGDVCTVADACVAGACVGNDSALCMSDSIYLFDDFETCTWTLAQDWECGAATSGPGECMGGSGCLATKLAGDYSNSRSFATNTATSPAIDLTDATNPVLSFFAWVNVHSFDGFNLKVSTDGTNYSILHANPAYDTTHQGEEAWAGDKSTQGWVEYTADLSAYAGQTIHLRFGLYSNSITTAPGVYIDDLVVAEDYAVPLRIGKEPLPKAFVGVPYSGQLERQGGSASATWSLVHGVNSSWLSIDPATGVLSGTPTQAGFTSFTVRVEEPGFTSNYAEKTYGFQIESIPPGYYYRETFDSCPDTWRYAGDWECGTPTNVGPDACHSGANCIATVLDGNHTKNRDYVSNFARSPYIHIPPTATDPVLQFWAWVETTAGNYAAFRVRAQPLGSSDLEELKNVDPPQGYNASTRESWGGDRSQYGWQRYTVDLSDYVGETIALVVESHHSTTASFVEGPGFYVDDLEILELALVKPSIVRTPYRDAWVNLPWTHVLEQSGGFFEPVWTIVGGSNHSWLGIDPATGVLTGTPSASDAGPVSVTVRAEKPGDPTSFDEWTLEFEARSGTPYYYTGFEGTCPDGWTLTGDWQCGIPVPPGEGDHYRPGSAYAGWQCIATQLAGNHSASQNWVTARSPSISLAGATNPVAYFRMWFWTWGPSDTGANLRIAVNGGAAQVHSNVDPPYTLHTLPSPTQSGWGGDHSRSGWRLVRADLSAYAGQNVQLEFGFKSGSSLQRPGVYIDEIIVVEE